MPASAVRNVDTRANREERTWPGPLPGPERARCQPRFRVVTRKSLPAPRSRSSGGSLHRSLLLAAFPVFCLLVYVLFWTLTMRGAYYRDHLQAQIKALRLEQAELEAEKRRLQSPGLILGRAARELGMQPAEQREFARVPALWRELQRRASR